MSSFQIHGPSSLAAERFVASRNAPSPTFAAGAREKRVYVKRIAALRAVARFDGVTSQDLVDVLCNGSGGRSAWTAVVGRLVREGKIHRDRGKLLRITDVGRAYVKAAA